MHDFKIIDKSGNWVVNTSPFRMVDGTNGNIFESGIPTKVDENDWLKGQSAIIEPCADPMQSDEPLPELKTGEDARVGPAGKDANKKK